MDVESTSKLIRGKKEICVFYNDKIFEEVMSNLNPKEIMGISRRSVYYWKQKERPIPVSHLVSICKNNNIEKINLVSLSTNSGNKINLPESNNLSLYHFLGLLLGDGCLCISKERELKRQSYTVRIAVNSKNRINQISRLMESLFGIKPSCHKCKGCYEVCIYSKALLFFLNTYYEIPIGEKYPLMKVPLRIKNDFDSIRYFLRGLMDSDGNQYIYRGRLCFQLRQKSGEFLSEVYNLFHKIGMNINGPYFDKANNSWVIWCSKKNIVDKFINEIDALKI